MLKSRNPFNTKSHNKQSAKEKEWGRVKFNPIKVREEAATPWSKYRNEFIQKQEAASVDVNSAAVKDFKRKREVIYRRNLIMAKKKEATKWERFDDDDVQKINKPAVAQDLQTKWNRMNEAKPRKRSDLLSKKQLENFNSKDLSYHVNNTLRKVITKTTILASGKNNLKRVVQNLKRQQAHGK